jgi:hypothetical protein
MALTRETLFQAQLDFQQRLVRQMVSLLNELLKQRGITGSVDEGDYSPSDVPILKVMTRDPISTSVKILSGLIEAGFQVASRQQLKIVVISPDPQQAFILDFCTEK